MTTATAPVPTTVAPTVGRLGLRWAVADALAVTGRNLRGIRRQPQLLVFSTIQPVMFVLLFNYVFGGAILLPPASTTSTSCCPGSSPRRSPSGPRKRPSAWRMTWAAG